MQIDWVALASALDLPAHRHQSVAKFIALSVKEKIARSNWAGEARNRGRFTDFESTVHETIALLESLRMFVYEHFLTELGRDKRLDSIFVGLSEHVYNLTDRLYPEWEASLQGGMV